MTPERPRTFAPPPGARQVTRFGVGLVLGDDGAPSGKLVLVLDPEGPAPTYLSGDPAVFEVLAARLMQLAHQARGGGGLQ